MQVAGFFLNISEWRRLMSAFPSHAVAWFLSHGKSLTLASLRRWRFRYKWGNGQLDPFAARSRELYVTHVCNIFRH